MVQLLCSLPGCPRQALMQRADGLCHDHAEVADRLTDIEKLQDDLRRDETQATQSICNALHFILERMR